VADIGLTPLEREERSVVFKVGRCAHEHGVDEAMKRSRHPKRTVVEYRRRYREWVRLHKK
jgi:hypothetical protein